MPKSSRAACPLGRRRAFTLIELLVSMAVLVLLVAFIAQMTSGMSSVINRGKAHIDTDGQARALLDRMAIDFGAMIKRSDVDCYLKGRPVDLTQLGNDQIAFYSEVPGYFSTTTGAAAGATSPTSISMVSYQVNTKTMHMERLCKGVSWDGVSGNDNPRIGFLPVPLASPLPAPLPSPMPTSVPVPLFPQVVDPSLGKPTDYEELGPQVFRFEYYYVLKGQGSTNGAPTLSLTPWYANHVSVDGMRDVAGIAVVIAVIDQRSRTQVPNDQLVALAQQMKDAPVPYTGTPPFTDPGDIEVLWTDAVNKSSLPRSAAAAIRIYTRCFYLNGVQP